MHSHAASPFPYGFMHSLKEDSTLYVRCEGESGARLINCSFVQTTIMKKSTDEIEKSLKNLDSSKDNELLTLLKSCKKMTETAAKLETLIKEASPSKREKLSDDKQWLYDLCNCEGKKHGDSSKETITCVRGLLREKIEEERKTCTISNNQFDMKFTKVSDDKWINKSGPKGDCGIISVDALERKSGEQLWTYSQARLSGDRNKQCKEMELLGASVYSWKASNESRVNCETIKLGY